MIKAAKLLAWQRGAFLVGALIILCLLLALPAWWQQEQKLYEQKIKLAEEEARQILKFSIEYKKVYDQYPASSEALGEFWRRSVLGDNLNQGWPLDPWGQAYEYRLEAEGPVVLSFGRDRRVGGHGFDKDIKVRVSF